MSLKNIKLSQSLIPKYSVEQTIEFPIYEIDLTNIIDNDKILNLINSGPIIYNKKEYCQLLINHANDDNEGVYESVTNLHTNNDWKFFVDEILNMVKLVENKLRPDAKIKTSPEFFHMWYALCNKKGGQIMHQHGWQAKWAVVYYAQANDNDAPITFKHKFGELSIKPKTGKLLLFPGTCWHKVELQTSDSKRIAVVGNIGF